MAKHKQQKHDAAGAKATFGKMRRKEFEMELARLQVELTRLQTLVQATGARIIVVFEGRDTAGKGGVISRIVDPLERLEACEFEARSEYRPR